MSEVQSPEVSDWRFRLPGLSRIDTAQFEWMRRVDHPGLQNPEPNAVKRSGHHACLAEGVKRQCELHGETLVEVAEDCGAGQHRT